MLNLHCTIQQEKFSFKNSRYVFQSQPERKDSSPETQPKSSPQEAAIQARVEKITREARKAGKSPEEIDKMLANEIPAILEEVKNSPDISKAEKREQLKGLLNEAVDALKEEAQSLAKKAAETAEKRAVETSHKIWDWAKSGLLVVGAAAATVLSAGIAPLSYGIYKGVDSLKESGREEGRKEAEGEARAQAREQFQRDIDSGDPVRAEAGQRGIKAIEMEEANEKKHEEAVKVAEELSDSSYFDDEKIGSYSGSDLEGQHYDYAKVHEAAEGAIAAAYILKGLDGAREVQASLKAKEEKDASSLRMNGVTITDVQWTLNDVDANGHAGKAFGKLCAPDSPYKNVDVASKSFVSMYLGQAAHLKNSGAEGWDETLYAKYEKYLNDELAKTENAIAAGRDASREAIALQSRLMTPDLFRLKQGPEPVTEDERKIATEAYISFKTDYEAIKGLKLEGFNGKPEWDSLNPQRLTNDQIKNHQKEIAKHKAELLTLANAAYQKNVEGTKANNTKFSQDLQAFIDSKDPKITPRMKGMARVLLQNHQKANVEAQLQSLSASPANISALKESLNKLNELTKTVLGNRSQLDAIPEEAKKTPSSTGKKIEQGPDQAPVQSEKISKVGEKGPDGYTYSKLSNTVPGWLQKEGSKISKKDPQNGWYKVSKGAELYFVETKKPAPNYYKVDKAAA